MQGNYISKKYNISASSVLVFEICIVLLLDLFFNFQYFDSDYILSAYS